MGRPGAGLTQVGEPGVEGGVARLRVGAQQRRRVQRDEHAQAVGTREPLAALAHHRDRAPEQRAGGRRAECDHGRGLHQRDLAFEPVQAGSGFALRRRLVDAALAAQLELEVLDRVGQVERIARPAELRESTVEKLAGGPDERAAMQVFVITGLLANQHQAGAQRPFAGHRLGRAGADRARSTTLGRVAQCRERAGGLDGVECDRGPLIDPQRSR